MLSSLVRLGRKDTREETGLTCAR